MQTVLQRAIDVLGGQVKVAAVCGGKVRQQHVAYWLRVGRVPAAYAVRIERACLAAGEAGVQRSDLAPDFPWALCCTCATQDDEALQ